MTKCHKLEINIRKEVQRNLDELNQHLKSSEGYLKGAYEHHDREYTIREIETLEAQISLLERIISKAKESVA